jgi:hypothetical protein
VSGQRAEQRARRLLEGLLTDDQREQLSRWGGFVVTGSGGRRYVVALGQREYVFDPVSDSARGYLPVDPRRVLPEADMALAMKLAIEADELSMRREACSRGIYPAERARLGPLFEVALGREAGPVDPLPLPVPDPGPLATRAAYRRAAERLRELGEALR